MLKIQLKEFDWNYWDYSTYSNIIYTHQTSPPPLEFYYASPFSFKWGKGEARIIIDDKVVHVLTDKDDKKLIEITPDLTKKYSLLVIKPTKGPIVIDEVDFFKELFTSNTFDAKSVTIGDKTFLTSSFVYSPKKDKGM